MIVSAEHKFVYMAPQKTGTTSLQIVLRNKFNAEVWGWEKLGIKPHHTHRLGQNGKHIIRLPKIFQDYFVFCTVRNPYERTISQYCHFVRANKFDGSFSQYLKKYLPNKFEGLYYDLKQYDGYQAPKDCVVFKISSFLRLENLEEDFNKLPFVKEWTPIPKLNETPSGCNPKYTKRTAALVAKYRAEDFEVFGYDTAINRRLLKQ
jgi:hypothetical protein